MKEKTSKSNKPRGTQTTRGDHGRQLDLVGDLSPNPPGLAADENLSAGPKSRVLRPRESDPALLETPTNDPTCDVRSERPKAQTDADLNAMRLRAFAADAPRSENDDSYSGWYERSDTADAALDDRLESVVAVPDPSVAHVGLSTIESRTLTTTVAEIETSLWLLANDAPGDDTSGDDAADVCVAKDSLSFAQRDTDEGGSTALESDSPAVLVRPRRESSGAINTILPAPLPLEVEEDPKDAFDTGGWETTGYTRAATGPTALNGVDRTNSWVPISSLDPSLAIQIRQDLDRLLGEWRNGEND